MPACIRLPIAIQLLECPPFNLLPSKMNRPEQSWDIFCRVIDNYGDIGVCWRLARQLAAEYPTQVRLWVDELPALCQIWPEAKNIPQQQVAGVEVRQWPDDFPANIEPAQVVIEAFACALPASYLAAMAARKQAGTAPCWFNLDYMSAEDWVEGCHGMVSVHPSSGLRKQFFFPGFTRKTGGLLREAGLTENAGSFQQERLSWLQNLGVNANSESLLISLFAYENPGIAQLIDTWRNSPQPIYALVPQGRFMTSLTQVLGRDLAIGEPLQLGQLTLQAIPFVSQLDYDRLLWSCDLNFVRGEDSLVRAQWAGKPCVWHIYIQEEDAHLVKLAAYLDKLLLGVEPTLAQPLREFYLAWNQGGNLTSAWQQLQRHWPQWQQLCQGWRQQLTAQPDLAAQLWLSANPNPASKLVNK